jgi:hypothetical protein
VSSTYLPSKRILVLIAVIVVAGVGAWLITSDGSNSDGSALIGTQAEDSVSANERDTDNDGLADWEEALWNTDKNDPDTDGDGDEDGDEVKDGRHPKIAGPNDQVNQQRVDVIYSQDAVVPTNRTNEAWKELLPYMASYISVTGGDKEIADEKLQEISEKISRKAQKEADTINRKKIADLQIKNNPNFQDIDTYFSNTIQVLGEYYATTNIDDELLIFAQATAGGSIDQSKLAQLEVVATDYRVLVNKLLDISVPESLASIHVEVVNNHLALAKATENMAALQKDPIRSMAGLKSYRELIKQKQGVMNELGRRIGQEARLLANSES